MLEGIIHKYLWGGKVKTMLLSKTYLNSPPLLYFFFRIFILLNCGGCPMFANVRGV